jgi:hypothetical protein
MAVVTLRAVIHREDAECPELGTVSQGADY